MTELYGKRVVEDLLLPHHVGYEVTPYNLINYVDGLVEIAIDDFCADEDGAVLLGNTWTQADTEDKLEFSIEVLKEIIRLHEDGKIYLKNKCLTN